MALAKLTRDLMLDKPHLGRRDRAQAVVQNREVKALQVGDVARDVEAHDLALALTRELIHAGEAFEHEARPRRTIPLAHDILVCPELGYLHRQVREGLALLVSQREDALQLADERTVKGL